MSSRMSNYHEFKQAQLHRVLNTMFPSSYIQLHHRPPSSICSLLDLSPIYSCSPKFRSSTGSNQISTLYEVSTEPSCREGIIVLRERLDLSLIEHQAKPVGLCPIRRAIYNQCFDELIRQVTVSCIEQGLLLFRIRNELHMMMNCYKGAYESGVCFGLGKAVEAEVNLEKAHHNIKILETVEEQSKAKLAQERQTERSNVENKLELYEKLQNHFADEMKKKDQVIEQQRSLIRALSQKLTDGMKSPI